MTQMQPVIFNLDTFRALRKKGTSDKYTKSGLAF